MRRGIRACPGENRSKLAYQTCQSHTWPSAGVGEFLPDRVTRRLSGGHHPHQNEDSDKSTEMNGEDETLHGRQDLVTPSVDQSSDSSDSDGQQGTVPALISIHPPGGI